MTKEGSSEYVLSPFSIFFTVPFFVFIFCHLSGGLNWGGIRRVREDRFYIKKTAAAAAVSFNPFFIRLLCKSLHPGG